MRCVNAFLLTTYNRYDTSTNSWTVCAAMAVKRRLLGATTYGNRIFVFGGSVDFEGHCCNVLEIYDIDTDSWIRGKDLPIAGET